MSELSHVKQLNSYINQVFPGGALFLVVTDTEFKRLFMELANTVLQNSECQKLSAARMVGKNANCNEIEWILSPSVHISPEGQLLQSDHHKFLWVERPPSTSPVINPLLICNIKTPLDDGEALLLLCDAIQAFMPENLVPALAVVASVIMGSTYQDIISCGGCSGVPLLYGEPGSCKSEAIQCGLALFGAHDSHIYNSQTTPSHLFDVMKQTTIPIAIDDIGEKAQDTWEELIIDAYNNTPRGTRSYNAERFYTLPVLTANWRYTTTRSRAFTRCITIPFVEHSDEPNATKSAQTTPPRLYRKASMTLSFQQCLQSLPTPTYALRPL